MSKERARLRDERQRAAAADRVTRERRNARRQRRRARLRRLVPHLPDRRSGRLASRRTRAQRSALLCGVAIVLTLIWAYGDLLSTKIALSLLVAAITPVLAVLTLDRRI